MLDLTRIPQGALAQFVTGQPWFESRVGTTVPARVAEVTMLDGTSTPLALTLVEIGVQHGRSDLYQLPLGARPATDGWEAGAIATIDGWVVYDALADPELELDLIRLATQGGAVRSGDAALEFTRIGDFADLERNLELKIYRRLDAGTNPELELLRFLNARGFPNASKLVAWSSYSSPLIDATLGIVHERVTAENDGWAFARTSLTANPALFMPEANRLGAVTGAMHALLASEPGDPDFTPEEPSAEALGLLEATLDEEIGNLFSSLPDDDALAPIAGRGEEVRDNLRFLSRMGAAGRVIRQHGNLHLGTVAWTGRDWMFLDLGGARDRSMAERRRKQSPLRDVASMLRSFAYAVSAATLDLGVEAPLGWEEHARSEFLAGYFSQIEATGLIPGGRAAADKLLALFELERAVHELRYELENRPEWLPIPVAEIARLLEVQVAIAG